MKKNFILTLVLALTLFFVPFSINSVKAEPQPQDEVFLFDGASSYKVTQNLINADIGYGITHIKDYAQSRSTRLNDYASCGPKDVYVGQQINVLSVPSNEAIRIVNWTYMTQDGWTKQTVRKLAENFEYHNPGWRVVAGVNGDFFDINGNGALPYTMNGIGVSDGEVFKPYGSATNVGFKNDGSSYPLVGGNGCETGPLKVQVLDEYDNLIKEYDVDKTNDELLNDDISVWFSYYVMNGSIREEVIITVSNSNTYISKAPVRCLPMNKTTVYGKGKAEQVLEETNLKIGQFAIETTNEELVKYINDGYVIRVQQNLVGKFAECDNITGAGAHLLLNGEAIDNGAKQDRHPRTVVGIKEDGSVVFMTVDGRQFESNMYGMNYDELSAALLHYGCVEAYNLDGGGSTTFITRNSYGDFDVHNSPSDGGERSDSNALLVVVPEISFNIDSVTDKDISFSYKTNHETTLSNLKVTVNNQTYSVTDSNITISGLNSKTKYNLTYSDDIVYKNSSLKDLTNTMSFTTGKIKPIIKNFYYEEDETNYIIHYNIVDPEKTTSACYIQYDRSTYDIDSSTNVVKIPKTKVKDPETFTINGRYDLKSSHSSAVRFTYDVDTFKDYTITYHLDGGLNDTKNPSTYNPNTEPFYLFDPVKLGYNFKGWYTEPTGGEKVLYIENTGRGNFELYARWELRTYNITYELLGGTNNELNKNTFTIEDLPLKLHDPVKEGLVFTGWTIDGVKVTSIPVDALHDVTIVAGWQKPADDEGGCNCGCSKDIAMIFATLSLISLSYLIIKKKH